VGIIYSSGSRIELCQWIPYNMLNERAFEKRIKSSILGEAGLEYAPV
jgi:hypothetical protein